MAGPLASSRVPWAQLSLTVRMATLGRFRIADCGLRIVGTRRIRNYGVPDLNLPPGHDAGKDALLGHDAVAQLLEDPAPPVTAFAQLRHFQLHGIPDPEPVPDRQSG